MHILLNDHIILTSTLNAFNSIDVFSLLCRGVPFCAALAATKKFVAYFQTLRRCLLHAAAARSMSVHVHWSAICRKHCYHRGNFFAGSSL